jgi:hypothetical protein
LRATRRDVILEKVDPMFPRDASGGVMWRPGLAELSK